MKLITLYLPESYIKLLDQLVDEHFYPNRAEAIRSSIRDMLIENNRFQVQTEYIALSKTKIAAIDRDAVSRISTIQKPKEASS